MYLKKKVGIPKTKVKIKGETEVEVMELDKYFFQFFLFKGIDVPPVEPFEKYKELLLVQSWKLVCLQVEMKIPNQQTT